MKQAIRRQPIDISAKTPKKANRIFRNLIFGCVVIIALMMMVSLLTYHPDDPAWSKTIAGSNINNWLGYRGAFFSDVLLTTIGQAAWFIPLLLMAYAYRLICQQGYKELDIETVMIRIVGVILVLLTIASLFNIYNPNNELVERGGAIGKFIGTLLAHSVDWMQALFPDSFVAITASKIILFFLLFITAMMASGCGPLAWIDVIGHFIIQSIRIFFGLFSRNANKSVADPNSELANIEHLMEKQATASHKDTKPSKFSLLLKSKDRKKENIAQATVNTDVSNQLDGTNIIESLLEKNIMATKIEPTINAPEPVHTQKLEPQLSSSSTPSHQETVTLTPKFEVKVDEQGEPKIPTIFKRPTIKSAPQFSEESHKENRIQVLTDWVNEPTTQPVATTIPNPTAEPITGQPFVQPTEPKEKKHGFLSQMGSLFSSQTPTTKPQVESQIDDSDDEFGAFLKSLEKYHPPKPTENSAQPEISNEFSFDEVEAPTMTFVDAPLLTTSQKTHDDAFPSFEILDETPLPTLSEITIDSPEIKQEPNFSTLSHKDIPLQPQQSTPAPSWNLDLSGITNSVNDSVPEKVAQLAPSVHQPRPMPPQTTQAVAPQPQVDNRKAELLKHFPMAGQLPSLNLLGDPPPSINQYDVVELNDMAQLIEEQLKNFSIRVTVANIEPGPVVTRFELDLAPGVKVAQINNLEKDIARGLSVTSVRVVDIIPGTSYVGLEIPNKKREVVYFKSGLASAEYQSTTHPLTLILGKSISGEPVLANLAKMPHLLVAGTTGSGKSVGVNTMLLSMLFKASPEELRLILIDPKMLELSVYNDIPHLLTPVVTDMKESANALRWCVAEMERRYLLMSQLKVRNIAGFNQKVQDAINEGKPLIDPLWRRSEHVSDTENPPLLEKLPFIVVVIDEFADMMMLVGKKCEELIARLAQKARASGIHLILATQRPSVDVITGLIKANIPTRIAFQVSSKIDSRTIIDQQGADTLLGHGDMLYVPPGVSLPIRVHGAFVDDHEVNKVVEFLKLTGEPDYIEDILQEPTEAIPGLTPEASGVPASPSDEKDPLFDEAVKLVVESRRASISYIQRRLRVGYQRAARLMEEMEELRIVTPPQPNGNREVLLAAENDDY